MKITILIIFLFSLTSCSYKPQVGPPWMQDMLNNGPQGPTLFMQGWKDGCETGISAASNAYQRQFYHFNQNSDLAQDNTYYTGWKSAFTYCSRYVFQYLRRNII